MSSKSFLSFKALYAIFLALPPALCHMEISWPYPLRSKFNPDTPQNLIDYSMTSPLSADGSNYPCKGYLTDLPTDPTVTYAPGKTYNLTLSGSATHGGGSCQISMSYDKGSSFKVIKSFIGGCPLNSTLDFDMPTYAPSGNALLAWTWQNKQGNREFYMNCAVVDIAGTQTRKQRRQSYDSFDALPGVWKANLESVTDCTTTEGEEPVYPHPGPQVQYGSDKDSSSPPAPGNCDGITAGSGSNQPSGSSPSSGASPSYSNSTSTLSKRVSQANSENQARLGLSTPSPSTTTVTVDSPETVTLTVYPTTTPTYTGSPAIYTASAPASACSGTSATCPCAPGYDCRSIGICTWACIARGFTTSSGFATSTNIPNAVVTTTTSRPTYTSPPSSQQPAPPASNSRPLYASGDLTSHLPCVPGTILCTSSTQFATCNYDASGSGYWSYNFSRTVAEGMECLTNISPYTSPTQTEEQQGSAPQGFYRDDRYVSARPNGDCGTDGQVQCLRDGEEFEVCDQGGWVDMGAVAEGTKCRNDMIVAV